MLLCSVNLETSGKQLTTPEISRDIGKPRQTFSAWAAREEDFTPAQQVTFWLNAICNPKEDRPFHRNRLPSENLDSVLPESIIQALIESHQTTRRHVKLFVDYELQKYNMENWTYIQTIAQGIQSRWDSGDIKGAHRLDYRHEVGFADKATSSEFGRLQAAYYGLWVLCLVLQALEISDASNFCANMSAVELDSLHKTLLKTPKFNWSEHTIQRAPGSQSSFLSPLQYVHLRVLRYFDGFSSVWDMFAIRTVYRFLLEKL